ncbi:hypothetical protein IWQ56_000648 [Coemansia nantahalensis]|nr:hypothetical protein IWQ56_000648 [Coemansia nantahalensis]
MPVHSSAQVLPLLVLERVLRYLLPTRPAAHDAKDESARTERQDALRPFMSLCRSWRSLAASMYYHSADVWPKETGGNQRNRRKRITLGEIVETGNQRYLRDLRMHVSVLNAVGSGEEYTTLASVLAKSGDLSSVYRMDLEVTMNGTWGHPFDSEASWAEELASVDESLNSFIKQVSHQLPNTRNIGLHCPTKAYIKACATHIGGVLEKMSKLHSDTPVGLTLNGVSPTKPFVANTSGAMLRSIDITMPSGNQRHVELVRRNAPGLEYLRVRKITYFSLIKMTCDPSNKTDMLVYPRLKTLVMEYLTGSHSAAVRQPHVDPFPRLQTLVCRGRFPFRSPGVLCGGHSHIIHLDIDMDDELLAVLDSHRALEKGAFSKLQCLSLKWAKNGRVSGMGAEKMCRLSAELGAQTRVIHIPTVTIGRLASPATFWESAKHLTVLDAPQCEFDIDQCITLLCANPQLAKANITFSSSVGSQGSRMPPLNTLTEYQNKYKSSTSNTCALGIHSARFNTSRQAAEFLVLLVDILDSIKRITIAPSSRRPPRKILSAVDRAKKRTVYKGHAFHDRVLFSSGTDW